jgi:hypothetical protein
MRGGDVVEIILVHIGVHRDPGLVELAMIFRTGQRSQVEKLKQVYGQLFLDHLDVMQNGLRRVVGKPQNVPTIGQYTCLLPG